MVPDIALLTAVTLGCGPAIYAPQTETVAIGQAGELDAIKANFLIKKLGLEDDPSLMEALDAVIDIYGRNEPRPYRAVIHYMLVKQFGRETVFV